MVVNHCQLISSRVVLDSGLLGVLCCFLSQSEVIGQLFIFEEGLNGFHCVSFTFNPSRAGLC